MSDKLCTYKARAIVAGASLLIVLLSVSLQAGCGVTFSMEKPSVSAEQTPQVVIEEIPPVKVEPTPRSVLEALLPHNDLVKGWRMTDVPVFYDEDNLFEYIDGRAEEYRAYDFYMLVSVQYNFRDSEDESVTVDIYDMSTDTNAFGIYSVQRYPEADYVEIGGQGFFTEASLEFWKARYFVKISTPTSLEDLTVVERAASPLRDVITRFGQNISSKIKGESSPPAILGYLPEKGYVDNSAVFALRDIMGQSFLRNGVVAEYIIDECRVADSEEKEGIRTTSRLFLTQYPSPEEALAAFNNYSKFLRESGGEIEVLSGTGEGAFATEVSFYGRVVAFHQGIFVGGILDVPEGSSTMDLLNDVLPNLRSD